MTHGRIGRPPGQSIDNADRRRRQLFEAAIDSIVQYGFAGTTLARVSAAAGVSQGTAVFYFKTKEALLEETLKYHYGTYRAVWQTALERAGNDPIERIMAIVFADLDPAIWTPRTVALWNSFWGEAGARPRLAAICETFDREWTSALLTQCKAALTEFDGPVWTPEALLAALGAITDGLWHRMHISPGSIGAAEGRLLLARVLASAFPKQADRILAKTKRLNRSLAQPRGRAISKGKRERRAHP